MFGVAAISVARAEDYEGGGAKRTKRRAGQANALFGRQTQDEFVTSGAEDALPSHIKARSVYDQSHLMRLHDTEISIQVYYGTLFMFSLNWAYALIGIGFSNICRSTAQNDCSDCLEYSFSLPYYFIIYCMCLFSAEIWSKIFQTVKAKGEGKKRYKRQDF